MSIWIIIVYFLIQLHFLSSFFLFFLIEALTTKVISLLLWEECDKNLSLKPRVVTHPKTCDTGWCVHSERVSWLNAYTKSPSLLLLYIRNYKTIFFYSTLKTYIINCYIRIHLFFISMCFTNKKSSFNIFVILQ